MKVRVNAEGLICKHVNKANIQYIVEMNSR